MRRTLGTPLAMAASVVIAATVAAAPTAAWTPPGSTEAPGPGGAAIPLVSAAASTDPGAAVSQSASFTAAERMLLRAIPQRIRRTCRPRRSDLARGTVAAVQCRPAARVVRDMAYYLLDGGPAGRVFEQRRKGAGVDRGRRCVSGKPGVTYWIGGMPTSELCYRNDDGRANLRFLEPATRCRQLKVRTKTLKTPTIYIAVLGRGRDIARLARWATDRGRARPSVLTRTISQPGSRPSPACPH